MKITIFTSVYNRITKLQRLIKSAEEQDYLNWELIVIDDGSTDNTPNLLKTNPDLYTKLVSLEKNSGKGAAVKAGLEAASGDFILFQDADLEYNPSEYYRLIKPIADGKADIYPRLGPTSEWDIGAAQCVVEEAGGSVLQFDNSLRLEYNKDNILNPFFIVSS